jgi:hypothetical protein
MDVMRNLKAFNSDGKSKSTKALSAAEAARP